MKLSVRLRSAQIKVEEGTVTAAAEAANIPDVGNRKEDRGLSGTVMEVEDGDDDPSQVYVWVAIWVKGSKWCDSLIARLERSVRCFGKPCLHWCSLDALDAVSSLQGGLRWGAIGHFGFSLANCRWPGRFDHGGAVSAAGTRY